MKLFVSEAEELIQKTEDEILRIEEDPKDLKPVQGLFFTFHTLKGLTAMAGFDNLSKFCHHFESFLQNAKEKKVTLSKQSNFIEMLFESLDVLRSVIKSVKEGDLTDLDEKFVEDIKDSFESFESDYDITFIQTLTQEEISNILKQKQNKSFKIYIRLEETCVFKKVRLFIIFRALNKNGQICWTNPAPEALEKATLKNEFEIYFITTKNKSEISHTMEEILEIENNVITSLKTEEFKKIIIKLQEKWEREKPEDVSVESRYNYDEDIPDEELEKVSQIVDDFSGDTVRITSVKVNVEHLEELMNYFGELVVMKNHINQLLKGKQDRTIARLIDKMDKPFLDIQEILFRLKLVRVESTFRKYKRLVRDLANETGKKLKLILEGTNVEIDRKILEELNSPLVQLIRNAIYHGIETPKERRKKGKNDIATLKIKTYRRSGSIYIEVQDNGAGINYDQIRKKVVDRGFYNENEVKELNEEDLHKFILMPGFSTLSDADLLSGRGMGMAIVAEKIKELGGDFTIYSEKDVGTRFTLVVPFTRAILRAQLIQISDDLFAIPTENIKQIYFFNPNLVEYIEGEQYYKIKSKKIPIIYLEDHLEMVKKSATNAVKRIAVWCQRDEDNEAVFIADKQLQQLDIVVKPFKSNYSDSRDILGSTITGEGAICLIIDVLSIIASKFNQNIVSQITN
jgi:two-component system chemotaxis sensor kinase CheA